MDETKLRTIAQLQEFLDATPEVSFTGTAGDGDAQRYAHISRVLRRFGCPRRRKCERGVVQAGYPLDMRYAGPREALLHALFRQNYGCSHQIVGRDHAGVGTYYGSFDAHQTFDGIPKHALQTQALNVDVCPHDDAERLQVSGTQLRKWLSEGADVPAEFSRPEVLRAYYAGLDAGQIQGSVRVGC